MKTHEFSTGQATLCVSKVKDVAEVAVWNKNRPDETLHMSPGEARRMARVLDKAATRAEIKLRLDYEDEA